MAKNNLRDFISVTKIRIMVFAICLAVLVLFCFVLYSYICLLGKPFSLVISDEDSAASAKAALGQFGDYMGGILNPIIALFSLIALSLTLLLQAKQMSEAASIANEQLEIAREEREFNEAIALASHWSQLAERYKALSESGFTSPNGQDSGSVHPRKNEYEKLSRQYQQKFEKLTSILEDRHEQLIKRL